MKRAAWSLAMLLAGFLLGSLYTTVSSESPTPTVGRYRFFPVGGVVGYRFDTASGELYKVWVNSESLVWEGIEGANVVGRFDAVPQITCERGILSPVPELHRWHFIDTATGRIWIITATGIEEVGDHKKLPR